MSKNKDWKYDMLDAVSIISRPFGFALGQAVWPHKFGCDDTNKRWRCGLGAAANNCARRLVKEGLLQEHIHRNTLWNEYGFHFVITEEGRKFLNNRNK